MAVIISRCVSRAFLRVLHHPPILSHQKRQQRELSSLQVDVISGAMSTSLDPAISNYHSTVFHFLNFTFNNSSPNLSQTSHRIHYNAGLLRLRNEIRHRACRVLGTAEFSTLRWIYSAEQARRYRTAATPKYVGGSGAKRSLHRYRVAGDSRARNGRTRVGEEQLDRAYRSLRISFLAARAKLEISG